MNRCIREPYVQWCERRTPSVFAGGAVYSMCALHEQCTPTSMFEKKLKNTNFSFATEVGVIFPEGANPLYALIKAGKY